MCFVIFHVMPTDTTLPGSLAPPLAVPLPVILDVDFDHSAAAFAVAAVDRSIASLNALVTARSVVIFGALHEAEGPFAVHLGDQAGQARNEATTCRDQLADLRRRLEDSSDQAAAEQVRRDQARMAQVTAVFQVAS